MADYAAHYNATKITTQDTLMLTINSHFLNKTSTGDIPTRLMRYFSPLPSKIKSFFLNGKVYHSIANRMWVLITGPIAQDSFVKNTKHPFHHKNRW